MDSLELTIVATNHMGGYLGIVIGNIQTNICMNGDKMLKSTSALKTLATTSCRQFILKRICFL